MTPSQAYKVVANRIWKHGEYKNATGGLVPSYYGGVGEYGEASDLLHEENGATHFSLIWEDEGKSVKLTFYQADSFGAAIGMKEVSKIVVSLTKE